MANLTEKELTAIEEQLSQEQLLILKFKDYANRCEDSELRAKYEQIVSKHQNHFDILLNMLN